MKTRSDADDVQLAADGIGPLFQRDYWATIEGSALSPEDVIERVRNRFPDFAPPETARFCRCVESCSPLDVGDEMDICISLAGSCKVRVVHADALSITLRTLEGHPEAGRITFSAEHDDRGRLVFRIRSRTRARKWMHFLGYLLIGKQMQSRTWIRFIKRLASDIGGRIEGDVFRWTRPVEERDADREGLDAPTYAPRGQGSL